MVLASGQDDISFSNPEVKSLTVSVKFAPAENGRPKSDLLQAVSEIHEKIQPSLTQVDTQPQPPMDFGLSSPQLVVSACSASMKHYSYPLQDPWVPQVSHSGG